MKTCARKGCIELAFPGGYFDGLCGRECQNMVEEYQRGRDEERAKALSGADAYLKHAITEATNEAYQRGKADERAAVGAYLRSPRSGCTFEADEVEKGEHEVKR